MDLVSFAIQKFANGINRLLVRSMVVPEQPLATLNIDPNKPTFYISQLNSFSDLAALQEACDKFGLPDPQSEQVIG